MDDLVRWLSAQLDEDQRIARAAVDAQFITCAEWDARGPYGDGGQFGNVQSDSREQIIEEDLLWPHAVHIVEHDPARVLREIDAKRQLLARYEFACHEAAALNISEDERETRVQVAAAFQSCVLLLAAVYADRVGYAEAIASLG